MKKKYVEPELFFESFELNSNVAGVCGDKVTGPITIPGVEGTVFTIEMGCLRTGSDDVGICYDIPTDGTRVFSS